MGYLDRLKKSETPIRGSVESVETPAPGLKKFQKGPVRVVSKVSKPSNSGLDTFDTPPYGPFQKKSDVAPPPLSSEDHEAIAETLDERAAIQEFDGGLSRHEAERAARAAMRVFRYRLTTTRGWCTLIAPGWDLADAEHDLSNRYGSRLAEVVEHKPAMNRVVTHG